MKYRKQIAALAIMTLASACAAGPAPANLSGAGWAPGQIAGKDHPQGDWVARAPAPAAATACLVQQPAEIAGLHPAAWSEIADTAAPLAPGDRLRIDLLGDADDLSGIYVIGSDGRLSMPGIAPVDAAGRSEADLSALLRERLVTAQIVRPLRNAVTVSLVESGGIAAGVSGAVFQPGTVRVGERSAETRVGLKEGPVRGDDNASRTIGAAIRNAGGVRPDADVAHVYLLRDGAYLAIDLSGLAAGTGASDVTLTSGDRIVVPSRNCFDETLVRPSPLTAPGIRVYMSNLTRGANNNAGAAIGQESTSLPYGTRLLQALVSMNCVGGSYMTSDRRAVLISRNPLNGESIVVERDVEKLVRMANRDDANPYLMPDDAIACYDSRWTNLSEALGMVSNLVNTATPAIIVSRVGK